MTRWLAGFIAGASTGLMVGAYIGALLTAAAIEAIGRGATLDKVHVPDEVPDAWSVTW